MCFVKYLKLNDLYWYIYSYSTLRTRTRSERAYSHIVAYLLSCLYNHSHAVTRFSHAVDGQDITSDYVTAEQLAMVFVYRPHLIYYGTDG